MIAARRSAHPRIELCERLLHLAHSARHTDPAQGRAYAHRAALLADAINAEASPAARDLRARAHATLGNLLRIGGDFRLASRQLSLAERHADTAGAPLTKSMIHSFRGSLFHARHEYRAAIREFGAAIRILRRLGDQPGVSRELQRVGTVLRSAGHPKTAAAVLEAALAGAETAADLAIILQNLVSALADSGKFSIGVDVLLALLSRPDLIDALGPLGQIRLGWVQARLAASAGAISGAREMLARSRAAFVEHGLARDAALVSVDLAACEMLAGNPVLCRRACLEADQLLAGTGLAKAGFAVLLLREAAEQQLAGARLLAVVSARAARKVAPVANCQPPAPNASGTAAGLAVSVDVATFIGWRKRQNEANNSGQ